MRTSKQAVQDTDVAAVARVSYWQQLTIHKHRASSHLLAAKLLPRLSAAQVHHSFRLECDEAEAALYVLCTIKCKLNILDLQLNTLCIALRKVFYTVVSKFKA